MRVGVPKEIKDHEDRVGLVPSSVAELVHHGHEVLIERGAGLGAGLGDEQYVAAGAKIVADAAEVFSASELIVKVKEPLATERKRPAGWPGALYLPASGARSGTDARPAQE